MLRSMTGFGTASGQAGPYHVRVELRSVNHRHLQIKLRLPAELSNLESEIEALLRKEVERGALALTLYAGRSSQSEAPLLDKQLARQYARQIGELGAELGLHGQIEIGQLVALPGVIAASPGGEMSERATQDLLAIVRRALEGLLEMRATEGMALAQDLDSHLQAIATLAEHIEKRMPKVVRSQHRKLRKRVAELLGKQHQLCAADLARELALLADRADVSEELARLKSHVAQFESEMRRADQVGRRLDFLVQELLREVNTIASKCNDAEVAHWSVDIKARIERLREQVQNIE